MSEIEARLARRLAIAFWKGERAERIEVALFDAAPKLRPPQAGYQWEQADPLTTFDLKRFNAVRGYQAQQGREISRCLKELRAAPQGGAGGRHGRTRATRLRNEPGSPQLPANDDAPAQAETAALTPQEPSRNEPGRAPDWPAGLPDPQLVEGSRLYDIWGNRHPPTAAPPDRQAASPGWAEVRTA